MNILKKYFKYACVLTGLALVSSVRLSSMVQEIEPELEQLLADNPDMAGELQVTKQNDLILTQADQVNDSEPSNEKKELDAQLIAISDTFNSIFHDYLFIDKTTSLNQTELCSLKLYIENEIARVKHLAHGLRVFEVNSAKWHIQRLSEIIYWFKFACLNLEVFSVSSDDSRFSVIKEPLDFVEMQESKLKILTSLLDIYPPLARKGPVPMGWTEITEKRVKSIIFKSLPEKLQSSAFSYILCGLTQRSRQAYYLGRILSQNLYSNGVVLAEEYFELVSIFYKAQEFGEAFDVASF